MMIIAAHLHTKKTYKFLFVHCVISQSLFLEEKCLT